MVDSTKIIELITSKRDEAKADDEMFGTSCNVFHHEMELYDELLNEIQKLTEVTQE